jgi:hypothetical protein
VQYSEIERIESGQASVYLRFIHTQEGAWKEMIASAVRPITLFGWFLFLSLPSLSLRAQSADATDLFETKIRPLLSAHCLSCHGAQVQMAGLNLATEASFLKGSEKGPVVQRGDPENSRLIQAVRYLRDIKMPPTESSRPADLRPDGVGATGRTLAERADTRQRWER